jgi:Uma2 family endonuclease
VSAVLERVAGSPKRWFTIADLAALPAELPTGTVLWELWDGELVPAAPHTDVHGALISRLAAALMHQGEWDRFGRVSGGGVGVVLNPEQPQTCVSVDLVFLAKDQGVTRTPEGYLLAMPALVADVRERGEQPSRIAERIERYLNRGARLVWDVDPGKKAISVHRRDADPQVLGTDDDLTADGIIPNLKVPVRRLFEDLDEAKD